MIRIATKPRTLSIQLGCLLLLAAGTPSLAQTYTQVQTFPFNFSNSGSAGPLTIVSVGDFTATAQPHDTGIGPLVSFQIDWDITFSGTGIATDDGASIGSGSVGGAYELNGISYNGNGGSNGDGGALSEPLSFTFNVSDSSTYLASNAGITYNPGLLAAVTGATTFPLEWTSQYALGASSATSLTGSAIGSVRLTYTYLPEASTNVAMGLAFAAVGGVVWRRRKAVTSEVAQAATK